MKKMLLVLLLMNFFLAATTATDAARKKTPTQGTSTAQDTPACLPSDTKPDDVVTIQQPKNAKVTVAQTLKTLGAKCNAKGQLVNKNGRPIYFYHLTGCWGMAPPNRDEILANQMRKIAELKKTYQVIEMTCNPS